MTEPRWRLWLALAAVWLVWGSTYFAIHVALSSFPPLGMAGVRLATAGVLLGAWGLWRGEPMLNRTNAGYCVLIGGLLFLGGNGSVMWAQQTVSSGMTAVLVATVPLYTALIGYFLGTPIPPRQAVGLLGGMAGIVALNAGKELSGQASVMALLTLGSIAWATGSVIAKKLVLPGPTVAAGAQMLAGGTGLMLAAVAHGESLPVNPSTNSIAALVYLLIFGSLIGFSAYSYLLRHASMPVATSYAYVNPLVAVLIGTTLGGEHLDRAGWLGLTLVVGSVALVTTTPPNPGLRRIDPPALPQSWHHSPP